MDGTKTTTNWIIAGLVALVVIIGGGWLIARERSGNVAGTSATSTESTSTETAATETGSTSGKTAKPASSETSGTYAKNPTTSSSGETISVSDQAAGATVTIANVSVTKPTWVAVRDARTWYLGWKLVDSSQSNVTVPLQRNTVAGTNYEVVLFVDNGDGQFAIHGGDKLVTDTNGAPVSSTFKAQ